MGLSLTSSGGIRADGTSLKRPTDAVPQPPPAPGGLLSTLTVHNASSSTAAAGTPVRVGYPAKRGDVATTQVLQVEKVDQTVITSQVGSDTYWDEGPNADDSYRHGSLSFELPDSIAAGGSAVFNVFSVTGSIDRTAPKTLAQLVAGGDLGNDYSVEFDCSGEGDLNQTDGPVWTMSRDHALAGPEYTHASGYGSYPVRGWMCIEQGPVQSTFYYWTRARNSAGDYHIKFRMEGWVTYYHSSGRTANTAFVGQTAYFSGQKNSFSPSLVGVDDNGTPSFSYAVRRGGTTLRSGSISNIGRHSFFGTWDSECNWDWDDGTTRKLYGEMPHTYCRATELWPLCDPTTDPSTNSLSYSPLAANGWQLAIDGTGNAGTIGPMTKWSFWAYLNQDDWTARTSERAIALSIGHLGCWDFTEQEGLPPTKSVATYNNMFNDILATRRIDLYTPTLSGVYESGFGSTQNGFTFSYQNGPIEASHFPNFRNAYFLDGDPRLLAAAQYTSMRMLSNQGGEGTNVTSTNGRTWQNPLHDMVMYIGLGSQDRDLAWSIREWMSAAIISPKYLGDGSTAHPYYQYVTDIARKNIAYLDWWNKTYLPTYKNGQYPQVLGGWTNYAGLNEKINGYYTARPWQWDYVAISLGWVVRMDDIGSSEMKDFFDDYFGNCCVNRFLDTGICLFYTTWQQYPSWQSSHGNTMTSWSQGYDILVANGLYHGNAQRANPGECPTDKMCIDWWNPGDDYSFTSTTALAELDAAGLTSWGNPATAYNLIIAQNSSTGQRETKFSARIGD